MPSYQVRNQFNKKLLRMSSLIKKKPNILLDQIIDEYYFQFLRENKLKDL